MEDDKKGTHSFLLVALWILLFLLLLVHSNAHAFEAISKGKAELQDMTQGEGSASILKSDDMDEAKGKALEEAKNEAILKVVGLYVSHEILSKEKKNLLKIFGPKKGEIIDEYKIISENRGEDGYYRVKIAAKIKEDALKSLVTKNLNDDRVIVITSEKNMGNPLKRHILEHELIRIAKGKGYQIVDYRTVKDRTVRNLVALIRQGDTPSVKKLGLYYLTDIVIVGFVESEFSEQTRDICSARATGQVKIHRIGNKTEILSLTKHNEKGFGSDREKAGIDAIKKTAAKMSDDGEKNLPAKSVNKITLRIREISSHASLEKAKRMLAELPYVREVKVGISNFDLEESTLYIKTTKGMDYISRKLAEMKVLVVRKVNGSEIEAEARKI
jgi:hypothetical protein